MKENYLDLYYKWMETGKLPEYGLCSIFLHDDIFNLIDPENGEGITYWGCDEFELGVEYRCETANVFGPLRQNIVLLMAAMNGEL